MGVTWLGAVLLPIGLLAMLLAPKMLLLMAVFFAGFTASSVFDLPSGQPISAVHLMALLFVINHFFRSAIWQGMVVSMNADKSFILLFLFMIVVAVTMLMPAIIDGRLSISSNQLADLYEEPLRLSARTIGRPLPLFFGVVFVFFMLSALDSIAKIELAVKALVVSGAFVAVWGLFQFACFYVFGIDYPNYIFNNAKLETAQGFAQNLGIAGAEIKRLSSVTHEPSVLSKYLLTVVPILLSTIFFKTTLFSRTKDRVALWLCIAVILLSTSSTGYFGLLVSFLVTGLIIGRYRLIAGQLIRWGMLIFSLLMAAIIGFESARDTISFMLFSKSESYSAIERWLSVVNSWEYFSEYPLLGVGWGVVTVNDLVVNILVNSGVIGLGVFLCLVVYVVHRALRSLDNYHRLKLEKLGLLRSINVGLLVAFILLIINGLITGIEFYLGYFYVVLGLLIATSAVLRRETHRLRREAAGVDEAVSLSF